MGAWINQQIDQLICEKVAALKSREILFISVLLSGAPAAK